MHSGHDETFVIIEGRLRFRTGDSFSTAVRRDRVCQPPAGTRLQYPFDDPTRYIAILTPSGYENYFARVAEHVARTRGVDDHEQTRELMAEYDTVLASPLADVGL